MDTFSYTDNVRAAFASCLPCFGTKSSLSLTAAHSEPRSAGIAPSTSSTNDLEHLLRDSDSDALSLHSNLGAGPAQGHRTRHRRRPKFSLTLFGYTLFGRPPIYLPDDENEDNDDSSGRRARAHATASSSTFDSDAAPIDASTIERLTSPDHYAALAAQRQQLDAEEAARRKTERSARRQERKARARAEALRSLNGGSPRSDVGTFEGFQGSGDGSLSASLSPPQVVDVPPNHSDPYTLDRLHAGDADDADLDGELYTRKKKPSAALSASGSDSRSRTSASLSVGDTSHFPVHSIHQPVPYPQTEMRLPILARKSHRTAKRTSAVSSMTSQSTSAAPYTPIESFAEAPAVAAFPVPQERYNRDGERPDFPSVGLLPGKRRTSSLDPRSFLAH